MAIFHSEKLKDVHPDLVKLVEEYGKEHNVIVVCGHRTKSEQNIAELKGNSKLRWPRSEHNKNPSFAVDLAPTKDGTEIVWKDIASFKKMGEDVLYVAKQLNLKIMWGGHWGNNFKDYPHFELV